MLRHKFGQTSPLRTRVRSLVACLVFAALAFSVASCASGELADIDEVLVSGPEVVDITATSARVLAVTAMDVACAVTYGKTTDYGQMATDLDMAGGGHQEHGPLLIDLEPDTTYHFSFGGVDARGRVFRGGDFTFKTLPATEGLAPAPTGDNLALAGSGARVVGVSSSFGGAGDDETWGSRSAIDGDARTEWSSDGDGDDAWIEIELPSETKVTSVGYWTRTMGTSAQVLSFTVTTERGEISGPFRLDGASAAEHFDVDLRATRLRFEAEETTGGNTGAVEIEVYGEPAS